MWKAMCLATPDSIPVLIDTFQTAVEMRDRWFELREIWLGARLLGVAARRRRIS